MLFENIQWRKAVMALFSYHQHSSKLFFGFVLFLVFKGVSGATLTLMNNCNDTVWPGISGKPDLGSTGLELTKRRFISFQAREGWRGRFWARTGCKFDDLGKGNCTTGDCGSGEVNCNGSSSTALATLVELTLGSVGTSDFYDVSLVDGFNLPVMVEPRGGSGSCATTGCWADLNRNCPSELSADGGTACRSACNAFQNPEFCCTGSFNTPSKCKATLYANLFKSFCPKAYAYSFDDANSTFTCTGANYTITFCPSSSSSPTARNASSPDSPPNPNSTNSSSGSGSDSSVDQAALDSTMSWLASLTTGASPRCHPSAHSKSAFFVAGTLILSLLVAGS